MSLDYVSLSAKILGTYTDQKNNLIQDNANQVSYPAPTGTEWMDNYILNYDEDANNGVMSAPSIIMVNSPQLLEFINYNSVCSGSNMMAAKLAEYWMSQLKADTLIKNVTNDAAKIQAPIEAYLCNLTSVESNVYYEHLFLFIENQVKSIIWTVTNIYNDTYTASIS